MYASGASERVCLEIKSSFQLYRFYIKELKKKYWLPTRALFNNRKAPSFSARASNSIWLLKFVEKGPNF